MLFRVCCVQNFKIGKFILAFTTLNFSFLNCGKIRITKIYLINHFLKISFIFRERGQEGEREVGKHQCVVASCTLPTGDLAKNPGMCPDWELNQQPFGLQAGSQSTEPHQPGC